MKAKSKDEKADELRPEYSDFGELLKEGVQGKYAARYEEGTNVVLLAPDVAPAFPSSDAVNEALRLVIQLRNLPSQTKALKAGPKTERGRRRTTV
jgi:hypothetical protein